MRSLTIVLDARNSKPLPIAYNHLIQGALYGCWRAHASELHDEGFRSGGKVYKLFTFSRLSGKSAVDRKHKTIAFHDIMRFTVRSPLEDLLDDCAAAFATAGSVRLGANSFPLLNLETSDRLLFPTRAHIIMKTPVTLHRTRDDGYTEYLRPNTEAFAHDLQKNAAVKAASFGVPEASVACFALDETLKKTIVNFKGTYVNGWMGDFVLATSSEMMAFLYNTGLAARNSQGFGMFDIDDRPIV